MARDLLFTDGMTENSRSVLVVDDDGAMRDMVVALLEDAGHRAEGASEANEAIFSTIPLMDD